MVTKNIKKILLNKDGNKFVVDTENIVRSVNGVSADENGNVSINNIGKCSASLREGQIYYNESTKQTFYYTNGNAYCIGNGN